MNSVHADKKEELMLLFEKLDNSQGLLERLRRQAQQAISLQKKINILQDELKRLQVSIRTQSKEINLSIRDLKESSTLFTEAVDPSSEDWELQYKLRKIEEQYQDCTESLEYFIETLVPHLSPS